MGYYVAEAERISRQLLHDELRFYGLYDFGKFEEDNPVVSVIPENDDAVKPVATDASNQELIEEAKEEVKSKPVMTELDKQKAKEAEKVAAQEIIEKFGVEYGQIKMNNAGNLVKSLKDL